MPGTVLTITDGSTTYDKYDIDFSQYTKKGFILVCLLIPDNGQRDWPWTSPKSQHFNTDWRAHFSVSGRLRVHILGRTNSSDKQSSFCFNFSRTRQFVFCVQCLRGLVGLWIVLAIRSLNGIHYYQQWWGRMSQSIWPNIGHWAKKVDFEVLNIHYSMFVFCWPRLRSRASDSSCADYNSEYLYNNGLLILYRN